MELNVCLTCLGKASKSHNVNKVILENLKIIDLIRHLVPLILEKQEFTLPVIICAKCLKELLISFKFQKKCLNSLQNFYKFGTKISSSTANADDNIVCNSLNSENSVPSPSEDFEKTVGLSTEPINASDDVISFEISDNEQNNSKIKKTSKNIGHCNDKISDDLPEQKLYQNNEKSSTVSTQCKICSKYFKQAQGLASHMSKTHLKKHLYRCLKCNKGFDLEEPFIRHCNRHLGIKPFPCSQCVKSFETVGHLNKHKLSHSKERIYTCKICDKKFPRIDIFKKHTRRHGDREFLQCFKCDKICKNVYDHKRHIENHKNEYVSEKEITEKLLTSPTFHRRIENERKLEVKNNNLENLARYDQANKNEEILEESVEYLLTHVKSENKGDADTLVTDDKECNTKLQIQENRFQNEDQDNDLLAQTDSAQCDLCQQVFKNSQGLAIHRSSTHFRNHLYQCDQCDRGFSVEEFYIKHRNQHLGIKTFKCNHCDKVFETNSILNQHLISHSDSSPHLCTACGKGFRRIDSLRQHMRRHGEERPFKCSVCAKGFKCLSDKLKHMSIHTNKRYECQICGTRLSSSESLSQHKMIHTGEKPEKCKYCDKSFISASNLKCHERIHTGEKPYKCQYCSKSFCQSSDRKKHIKRMHKSELEAVKSEKKEGNC